MVASDRRSETARAPGQRDSRPIGRLAAITRGHLVAAVFAVLVLASFAASCIHGPEDEAPPDDASITSTLESRLAADPDLAPFDIEVHARRGVVTLRGQVEEPSDRTEAQRLARRTRGVVRVINEIEVLPPAYSDDSPYRDAWLTTRTRSRLAAHLDLRAAFVQVHARDGVLTLSGHVDAPGVLEQVERLARRTRGVKRVVNEVEIGAQASSESEPSRGLTSGLDPG